MPGVKGIGDKTAVALIEEFGPVEEILKHIEEISKKRPREALREQADNALLSKELVTIHTDLDVPLDLEALRVSAPDAARLRELFVELEFHGLAKAAGEGVESAREESAISREADYEVIQSLSQVRDLIGRVRAVGRMAFDTETVIEPGVPIPVDPLRSRLVGLTIGLEPGKAYYLPFRHRSGESSTDEQGGWPSTHLGPTFQGAAKPRGRNTAICRR